MKQKILPLLIGCVFFFSFIIFTIIAKLDLLIQLDFDTTAKIQDRVPVRFDYFFSLVSLVARFDVALIILLILFFIFRNKLFSLITFGFFGFAHVVELIGKLYLEHPGPPFMFYRAKKDLLFPDLYVQGSSYPSGHSLRAMFLTVLIVSLLCNVLKKRPLARLLAICTVCAMGVSILLGKIVLGQHWTSDVVGGAFLGLSFSFFSLFIVNLKMAKPKD